MGQDSHAISGAEIQGDQLVNSGRVGVWWGQQQPVVIRVCAKQHEDMAIDPVVQGHREHRQEPDKQPGETRPLPAIKRSQSGTRQQYRGGGRHDRPHEDAKREQERAEYCRQEISARVLLLRRGIRQFDAATASRGGLSEIRTGILIRRLRLALHFWRERPSRRWPNLIPTIPAFRLNAPTVLFVILEIFETGVLDFE